MSKMQCPCVVCGIFWQNETKIRTNPSCNELFISQWGSRMELYPCFLLTFEFQSFFFVHYHGFLTCDDMIQLKPRNWFTYRKSLTEKMGRKLESRNIKFQSIYSKCFSQETFPVFHSKIPLTKTFLKYFADVCIPLSGTSPQVCAQYACDYHITFTIITTVYLSSNGTEVWLWCVV